jgi:tRNA 2-selenouridine synthase
MLDDERAAVGICYKQAGQAAAIELGYELAGPHLAARAEAWRQVSSQGPSAISCWRGGLRSALAARHLGDPKVPTITGGYKAIRAYLQGALEEELRDRNVWVLGGLTGSGKTELIRALGAQASLQAMDLEELAGHRGSAFGALSEPQVAQATFENALAAEVILHPHACTLLFEDESRRIGQRTLPEGLWNALREAPMLWLEAPLSERVARVFHEYVRTPAEQLGVMATQLDLLSAVQRIQRRLGDQRVAAINGQLEEAKGDWFNPQRHEGWIELLLREYYDRLYLHAFERSTRTVLHRGNAGELRDYLRAP